MAGRATSPPASSVEHDLDDDGRLAPVARDYGENTASIVVGLITTYTATHPDGMNRVDPARRSRQGPRLPGRTGVPAHHRRPRPGRGAGPARRVVRPVGRGQDRHGQRHREHGLDRPGAAPHRALHPGRRGDQRGGGRHQRRRPALLERRSDHAHAHPGNPRHDPRVGHGAHRQAGPRVLRRGVGRGQPGDRRLRAGHGAERPGPVLGAGHRRRLPHPAAPLRAHLRGPGRARPTSCRTTDPVDRDIRAHPHTHGSDSDFTLSGEIFSETQPRPQESPSTSARSCGRRSTRTTRRSSAGPGSATPRAAVVWDVHLGGWPVCLVGLESRPLPRRGLRPRRRPRPLDIGDARSLSPRRRSPGQSTVPAGTVHLSCWPTSPASTARPSRCASSSSRTGPRSAGRW